MRITGHTVSIMARGAVLATGAGFMLCLSVVAGQAQQQAAVASKSATNNQCAIYGAGYVAVQGSGSCVRIGGRVRLELNTGSVGHAYAPGGPNSAPVAPFGAQAVGNRTQVRMDGGRGQR